MTDPWTKSSAVVAVGALAITIIQFFLGTPPSTREVTLMALASIFGCCIGCILAFRVEATRRPKAITRAQRVKDLDDEIENAELERVSLQGAIEVLQGERASISYMNRRDLTADYDAKIRNARQKAEQTERTVKRLEAERLRMLQISNRKFRKEFS